MRTIITPRTTGVLILESVPTNASVYVDNTLKGTTPLTLRTITTGSHEVSFRLTGYKNYTTKVTVTTGAVATVSEMLSPIITETVSGTVAFSVSVTSTVMVTQGTITTPPRVTTVSPPDTQRAQQTSRDTNYCLQEILFSKNTGRWGQHLMAGSIIMLIIRSDDPMARNSKPESAAGYRCGKRSQSLRFTLHP